MARMKTGFGAVAALVVASAVAVGAQWPKYPATGVPRDAQGNVQMDAPTPRTADGKPGLSGLWMRAESGPPRQGGPGRQGARGQAPGGGAPAGPPAAGGPPPAA